MIIWGSKARMKTVGTGQFYCPSCRQPRWYAHKHAKRYFTLYFIPLFPIGDLGEFVECQTCHVTFKSEVLKLKPPVAKPDAASLLNTAKTALQNGQPVEYVTKDLVAAGIERDTVLSVINSLIGEQRKFCAQCNLTYAPNVETCLECKQLLTEKT